jgi:spore maturation protein CgeB
LKLVYFTHSLFSCWNHGNVHFQRGVLRELRARGHDALALEPTDAWSLKNLVREQGANGIAAFQTAYPDLRYRRFSNTEEAEAATDNADVVLVHEWNDPALVAALGRRRRNGGHFTLLFHDTHHRVVSDPDAIRHFDLDGYDGVLAFGAALAEVYRRWGWGERVFVWHEAADTTLFHPPAKEEPRAGLIWIGNWADEERTAELEDYLLRPVQAAGLPLDVFGVRYPAHALARLERVGARFHGWIANARVPDVFASYMATVHVPRRFYVEELKGIPTIRVFEALSCGIPLISSPWCDTEGLFRPNEDYLLARDPTEMRRHMTTLNNEPKLRRGLSLAGLTSIRARHSCAHRVDELLAILAMLNSSVREAEPIV